MSLLTIFKQTQTKNIYIDNKYDGNDPDGSKEKPYKTFSTALANADTDENSSFYFAPTDSSYLIELKEDFKKDISF